MVRVGLDIGGTKCAVSVGRENGQTLEVLGRRQFATGRGRAPQEVLEELASTLTGLLREMSIAMEAVEGVGISCGGPLNTRTGTIHRPPNLPLWDSIPIVSFFKERFGRPVYLQNDANACAIAEWKYGAAIGRDNVVFLTFGTGLGAGLILNGRLYEGSTGMAGELGHIRLAKSGPVGYFKEGSFEGFCSGGGIANLGRLYVDEAQNKGDSPLLLQKAGGDVQNITAKLIAQLAGEGDPLCRKVYEKSGEMLGYGLSVLVDLLNPQVIVIGSVYARSRMLLESSMRRILTQEALSASLQCCDIVPARLLDHVGDYAALSVASGQF